MQITKNKILNFFLILILFFTFAQIILIKNVRADTKLLDTAQKGGLDKFSEEIYNTTDPTDIRIIVALIIKVFLGFLGTIFLGIIVFGGFKWMTAGGNEENIGDAKKMIKNGAIGLTIILISYSLTAMIMDCVLNAVENPFWSFC